ncbi:MAG TPA: hypothetical protein VKA76_06020 [Gammaproteobacteria bacterium]|nr:hypothetical protein [Gammaproteobacteria bacterium]
MRRIDRQFRAGLDKFELSTLEKSSAVIYGLTPELRLCYFNPAWFTFARDNGADTAFHERFSLGTPLEEAIEGPLQGYYVGAYRSVFVHRRPWDHDYECSSDQVFRCYHQRAYPLAGTHALVVVNSLRISYPQDTDARVGFEPDENPYRDSRGFVTQCAHCRRTQRAADPKQWDWVPAWVTQLPARTSHFLCPLCFDYYYLHHDA